MEGLTAAVCTRNRPRQLARALASLRQLSPAVAGSMPYSFEIFSSGSPIIG